MPRNITHDVDRYEIGASNRFEIGGPSIPDDGFPHEVSLGARLEIGAAAVAASKSVPETDPALAVRKVIQTARDHRQPPPVMKAVPVDAPLDEDDEEVTMWFADLAEQVGCMVGSTNPFPIMTKLLTRFGAGQERPRYVRVDTRESYDEFLASCSPEMSEFRDMTRDIAERLDEHVRDPHAHDADVDSEDLVDAIEEAESLGAAAHEAEKDKKIDCWLKDGIKENIRTWREGDMVGASLCMPGGDLICTSMTPASRGIEEMEQHAANANVSAAAVIGMLPAMGEVLGAGTLIKEMAAATPSLLSHPSARAGKPFMCRIEPKSAPSLCALTALALLCTKQEPGACAEWDAIASAAAKGGAKFVSDAMKEAVNLCRQMEKTERIA